MEFLRQQGAYKMGTDRDRKVKKKKACVCANVSSKSCGAEYINKKMKGKITIIPGKLQSLGKKGKGEKMY